MLSDRTRVLDVHVLRGDLHIEQRGLDIGMTHQVHERGEADTGPQHV